MFDLFKVKKKLFKSFAWSTVHVAWALSEESITVNHFRKHALHSNFCNWPRCLRSQPRRPIHSSSLYSMGYCGPNLIIVSNLKRRTCQLVNRPSVVRSISNSFLLLHVLQFGTVVNLWEYMIPIDCWTLKVSVFSFQKISFT